MTKRVLIRDRTCSFCGERVGDHELSLHGKLHCTNTVIRFAVRIDDAVSVKSITAVRNLVGVKADG